MSRAGYGVALALAALAVAAPARAQFFSPPLYAHSVEYYHAYPGYPYAPFYPPLAAPYYPTVVVTTPLIYPLTPQAFLPRFQNPWLSLALQPRALRYQRTPSRFRAPANVVDQARRQLRVETVEPGVYSVRWLGPRAAVTRVELEAVGEDGKTLDTLTLREAPFEGRLRVPAETVHVLVSQQNRDGSSASIKLPVERFRALEPQETPSGAPREGTPPSGEKPGVPDDTIS